MQNCPICKSQVQDNPRYPSYVCERCVTEASDASGRKVEYFNSQFGGFGCTAKYQGTKNEHYPTNKCFIKGVECLAHEAYFGGIVVQPSALIDRCFKEERTEPWPE